jgi:CBS domain-containing protein
MTQSIREVMTTSLVTLPATTPVTEAAKAMKERNIGDVIVMDDGHTCGIVTDRDLVVRALAEGLDPRGTKLKEVCSQDLVTISPSDSIDKAITLMRERALRRLPVVEDDRPVGIVSIGDLALERDPESALADISAAPPND